MKSALAIVLARGGSKGLPRKNALEIGGRACVEWTLEDACEARSVGWVVLSTDDAELRAIGEKPEWKSRGVRVVERSADLAGDTATVDAAAREALRGWERLTSAERGGETHEGPIVILYGNVPIRPQGLIDRAVACLVEHGADSVQSYAPVGKYHPWWMARVDETTGAVRPWEGEVLNHGVFRRQDLPPVFVPDGGVIVVTRAALMLEIKGVSQASGPHAFFGRDDRRRGVVTREGEVVDIDSRTDLMVARAMVEASSAPGRPRGTQDAEACRPCA